MAISKREPSGPSAGDRVTVITDALGTHEPGEIRSIGDGDTVAVTLRPDAGERTALNDVLWVKDEPSAQGEKRPVAFPAPDPEPASGPAQA